MRLNVQVMFHLKWDAPQNGRACVCMFARARLLCRNISISIGFLVSVGRLSLHFIVKKNSIFLQALLDAGQFKWNAIYNLLRHRYWLYLV